MAMNPETRIGASITGYVQRWQGNPYTEFQRVTRLADDAANAVRAAAKAIQEANEDPRLSEDGKEEKRQAAIEGARKSLKLEDRLAGAQTALEELRARIRSRVVEAVPETPAEVGLASDIRAHVKGLSEKERLAWVQKHSDDPKVASAIFSAPAFLSGLPEEFMEVARASHLQKKHPELAAQLGEIDQALVAAERVAKNTVTVLNDLSPPRPLRGTTLPRAAGMPT